MGDGGRGDAGGFLGRWSRRKRADRRPAASRPGRDGAAPVELARVTPPQQLPPATDAEARLPATSDDRRSDEKAPADLPPVEKLDKDSDYTQFLRKGVPETLKRQALKRLWTSDPQFHVVDPFTEYGGDYTVVVPIGASLYKPGLGYLSEQELEQQKNLFKDKDKDKAVAEDKAATKRADGTTPDGAAAPGAGDAGDATAEAAMPSPPDAGAAAPDTAAETTGEGAADDDGEPPPGGQ